MSLTLLPAPAHASDAPTTQLTIRIEHAKGARTTVTLRGEADCSATAQLSDALSRVISSGSGDVVVDLENVEFVDTAIVRVLATARHLLADRGRTMTFRSPTRLARKLLALFALD